MRIPFALLLVLLLSTVSFSQKVTISGYVTDLETGEPLIGATIYDVKSGNGAVCNEYGFYSLTLKQDSVFLRASFVGYQAMEFRLKPAKDLELNVTLSPSVTLDEINITATALEQIEKQSQMSTVDIPMEKVKALPVLLGEQDVLKVIQLLPGVQSGTEGSSGIYVRGGGPEQNLILLDGVPIYNASHLFGFFSVFNADAINSVKLIKGGFPARYGGRLSSVLDIRMKEGNMKEYNVEGSVGIVASKLTVQGPIKKDKTSFIVSGRRTYIDLLARPFVLAANNKNNKNDEYTEETTGGYYFWDLNAKINHVFSQKSRLYASGYFGRDRFYAKIEDNYDIESGRVEEKSDNSLRWGNAICALRWNRILGPKLFSNITGTYSQYQFGIGFEENSKTTINDTSSSSQLMSEYMSGIRDWSAKIDFSYHPNSKHAIKFGAGNTYHTFTPGVNQFELTETGSNNIDTSFGSFRQFAHEHWVYIEDDWEITPKLKINAGVHLAGFLVKDTWHKNIQPRLSGRYLVGKKASIKFSYARMSQFLHLLTNPSIGLPTDLWVPVTESIAPQLSNQFALGYARSFKKGFQVTVEAYYKEMDNLIDYKEGTSFIGSAQDWQEKVVVGKGNSYGAEILIERKLGKTTGWLGYTLSWTNRQFDELNFGNPFPYRYDRRHDISVAITHKFNERIDIGIVWVYGTGNAVTLAQEQYLGIGDISGPNPLDYMATIDYIQERNNYRMPSYHRLDVGVNFHKQKKRYERTWSVGLYNAYSRQNPFFLYFSYNKQNLPALYQISLFPIIPSISYSFKF